MSAGLRGAARVRRVRRLPWGGESECVWSLNLSSQRADKVNVDGREG